MCPYCPLISSLASAPQLHLAPATLARHIAQGLCSSSPWPGALHSPTLKGLTPAPPSWLCSDAPFSGFALTDHSKLHPALLRPFPFFVYSTAALPPDTLLLIRFMFHDPHKDISLRHSRTVPGTSQAFHKYLLNKGKNKQGLCSNNLLSKNSLFQMLVCIQLPTSPKYLCARVPNSLPPSPKGLLMKSLLCCRQQSLEGQWAVSISPSHQNG